MATLGEKLKAANEVRAADISAAETRKREEERAKYERDKAKIEKILNDIKDCIVADIENGIKVKNRILPKDTPFNTYSWPNRNMTGKFDVVSHAHFSSFQKFFDWADENGLVGLFNYEWDGGGIDSWFTVNVKPK